MDSPPIKVLFLEDNETKKKNLIADDEPHSTTMKS